MENIKEYKIRTIEDFFNIINKDNYENLMIDFIEVAQTVIQLKEKIKEKTGEYPESICKEFTWKDDDIRGVSAIHNTDPETGETKTYKRGENNI